MRIKARSRRCHKIDWRRLARILSLSGGNIPLHPVNELLVCGSEVRSSGIGSIVAVSGCRWPGMKISRPGKTLTDNSGSNRFSVLLD